MKNLPGVFAFPDNETIFAHAYSQRELEAMLPARAGNMASSSRCEYACAKMVSLSGNANTPGRFFIVINGQVHGFSNQ